MAKPRASERTRGLTAGEVAKQLRYSRSNVDRLRRAGLLPGRRDGSGNWRYQPAAVAEAARELGRSLEAPEPEVDGPTAAKVYDYFRAPWWRGETDDFARIVSELRLKPRVVRELWGQYQMGGGVRSEEEEEESREMARSMRYYDQHIAAGDAALGKRRTVFMVEADDSPPSER